MEIHWNPINYPLAIVFSKSTGEILSFLRDSGASFHVSDWENSMVNNKTKYRENEEITMERSHEEIEAKGFQIVFSDGIRTIVHE
jgi:hypothetical protein